MFNQKGRIDLGFFRIRMTWPKIFEGGYGTHENRKSQKIFLLEFSPLFFSERRV
jgi:hypothetical protein